MTADTMTADAERWIRNFVDGRFVEPDDPDGRRGFGNVDPATGRVHARVHEAGSGLVDRAVTAARRSLGSWSRTPVRERTGVLRRAADLIEERFEEFVAAEVADTGKPVAQARELDVARVVANFRSFADVVAAAGQESFVTDLPGGHQALNYAVRKPLGVVAVIVPWNLPLLLLTWKVAAALACGNTVVVKPGDQTPGTAALLAQVLADAGLPAGAYNVVHGFGGGSAGQHLTEHPGVDGVTFTGSTATGSQVMRTVAPRVRPVSFELGGKNAALVFDDADLDETLEGLTRSVFADIAAGLEGVHEQQVTELQPAVEQAGDLHAPTLAQGFPAARREGDRRFHRPAGRGGGAASGGRTDNEPGSSRAHDSYSTVSGTVRGQLPCPVPHRTEGPTSTATGRGWEPTRTTASSPSCGPTGSPGSRSSPPRARGTTSCRPRERCWSTWATHWPAGPTSAGAPHCTGCCRRPTGRAGS